MGTAANEEPKIAVAPETDFLALVEAGGRQADGRRQVSTQRTDRIE